MELMALMPDLVLRHLVPRDVSVWHRTCRWTAACWTSKRYIIGVMQTMLEEAQRLYQSTVAASAFYSIAIVDEFILALKIARALLWHGLREHNATAVLLAFDPHTVATIFFGANPGKSAARNVLALDMTGMDDLPPRIVSAFTRAYSFIECRHGWTTEEIPRTYSKLVSFTPVKSVVREHRLMYT
jgi:hypothetical protein